MKKRIVEYMQKIDELLKNESAQTEWDLIASEHLVQIGFFQHERLIHLIVTVVFALLTLISILFCVNKFNVGIFILCIFFLILLVPYISHYYFLENSVQKMYLQYDTMIEHQKATK